MNRKIKKLIHWSLLASIALYLLTGLGITQYGIMEALTFGLLTKNLSFVIHDYLLWPFIALLAAHLFLTIKR